MDLAGPEDDVGVVFVLCAVAVDSLILSIVSIGG